MFKLALVLVVVVLFFGWIASKAAVEAMAGIEQAMSTHAQQLEDL